MKKTINIFILFVLVTVSACNRQSADEKKECCSTADSISSTSDSFSSESLYQISGNWETEEKKDFKLAELKGKVQVVAMIFSHCEYACPRIVADMKIIEDKIPKGKRDDVNFLLVSFDVERDTPERLNEFKRSQNLNDNWTLLHGEESLVRMLSVLLDVKYEKQADGNFAHSNIITVLDQNGVIRSRVEGLGADAAPSLKAINLLIN